MTPIAFSWRSLAREPLRASLGICGIAMVGALLFNMLLLSNGLLVSFGQILEGIGFDVRVTSTEALPTFGPLIENARATAAALRALPEVEEAVPLRVGRAEVLGPDGSWVSITWIGSEPHARGAWSMIRGESLPSGPGEPGFTNHEDPLPIVISPNLARSLQLEPGAPLRLRAEPRGSPAAFPPVVFRVSGIASFPFETASGATAVTTLAAFEAANGWTGHDEADILLIASRREFGPEGAVAAIRRLRPDLHTFSNEQFLSRLGRTDFSYFRQISFVLSAITLFFAFLLVATILTVSVNQRLGEVAALRAIGFSRRRIAADLLCESALLVGTGGVLALPVGAALARVLDLILRSMPDIPERLHFFVFEPRAVLLHGALLGVAGLLAAVYPVYLAARLPIAATLRKEVVS